ncbi:hypothetical protein BT96DRAFT_924763, partial [Gymnopus androsaceus JB14]
MTGNVNPDYSTKIHSYNAFFTLHRQYRPWRPYRTLPVVGIPHQIVLMLAGLYISNSHNDYLMRYGEEGACFWRVSIERSKFNMCSKKY